MGKWKCQRAFYTSRLQLRLSGSQSDFYGTNTTPICRNQITTQLHSTTTEHHIGTTCSPCPALSSYFAFKANSHGNSGLISPHRRKQIAVQYDPIGPCRVLLFVQVLVDIFMAITTQSWWCPMMPVQQLVKKAEQQVAITAGAVLSKFRSVSIIGTIPCNQTWQWKVP